MSERSVQLIKRRLRAAARRMTLARLLHGLILTLGVVSAASLVFVAVEAGFWIGTMPRSVLFWTTVALLCGLGAVYLARPLLRLMGLIPGVSDRAIARRIGARRPEIADRLVNFLDLAEGRASPAPVPLLDRAVRMLGEAVSPIPFEQTEDFAAAKRIVRRASAPVAGLLLFLIAAPTTFLDASYRLLSPGASFERPAPFAVDLQPGFVEIVKGEALDITARVLGAETPRQATLHINILGEEITREIPLVADSAGSFSHRQINVREPLRYRVSITPVVTPWHAVRVLERPIVHGLQVDLQPPSYSGLPPRSLPLNTGDITALVGARSHVTLQAGGGSVAQAFLLFDDGRLDSLDLSPDGVASGTFTVRRQGAYQVVLRSDLGIENADPIRYSVTPISDRFPVIELMEPARVADLDAALFAALHLRLQDDFGFSRLGLSWRLAESRFNEVMPEMASLELPVDAPRRLDQVLEYGWALGPSTGLDIVPGDVIEYYVQVWDNDAVGGFKSARSVTHRLRLPSLAERYADLTGEQEETEDEMESLVRETEVIRDQFDEMRDQLRQKQQGDWDDKRQLESLQESQRQIEERIDDLAASMEEASEQMEDHALVSADVLEMFEELQRVTEEINSPELMEALRELQEALEDLNLRLMQESMEKFEFNEEMFSERLERALDLFKQLQVQQMLEEAALRAEDLASEQEQLAKETAEEDPDGEELSREQLRAKEEMEQLQEKMAEIERRMEELRRAPQDQMDRVRAETEKKDLPKQMQANAEQMKNGQMQQANQGQQQMNQDLNQLQQQLEGVLGAMQGRQMQINFAALRRVLSDILRLSHDQEKLRRRLTDAAVDSPLLREFAQRQITLSDGLGTVSDSLQQLAREIPQMRRDVQQRAGSSLLAMRDATEALADRNGRQAMVDQQQSMMHLNELALLLSDLMEQMMNSSANSSGGGMSMEQMIQQLQQMAGRQEQLNQEIQDMLGRMQGDRLSVDMQERLRQIGSQQQTLRRQLREMARHRELANQLTGDLNRIAEQMEETIHELQSGAVNRRTQERQQQILTRLLDASRSMQERGKQKRREGRRGVDIQRDGPGALDYSRSEDELRKALLEALESGYAPDYQELIKRYFELLQEESRN